MIAAQRRPRHIHRVTLLVEPKQPAPREQFKTWAAWANQETTKVYEFDTVSSAVAELNAITEAKHEGFDWLQTLSIQAGN